MKCYKNIQTMLKDDFGIVMKLNLVESLFKDHSSIEDYEQSCNDTFDRDNIIEYLCLKLDLPSFPLNGDSEIEQEKFKLKFKEKAQEYDIQLNWD